MTAPDPAVALSVEELASLYRSAHEPNWRVDGAASVDRALLARVHAELTALRARVGEVERETATVEPPPGWEQRLDVRKREANVADASVALREAEAAEVPGFSIAELEAAVPVSKRRTDLALAKWRTAVDALLAARAVAGEGSE